MPRKTGTSGLEWDDGIIVWYDGPEWDEVAEKYFERAAVQVEAYAKSHAPWDDRTGDARRSIYTEVDNIDGQVSIYLSHGVEYGKWLELIQNGRFAIIMKTLERYAPLVMGQAVYQIMRARKGKSY